MKKLFVVAFAFASSTFAMAQNWNFDKSHSNVKFSVTHMMVSETEGKFKKFSGTLDSKEADFKDAKIDFTIEVASIDTDDDQRDGHLKSADFFDVATYPTITFKSTSFTKTGANTYKLTGNLTMRGVTKTVSFDVTGGKSIKDPYGFTRVGFKIKGLINRMDYGVKWNAAIEAGGMVVSENVEFTTNVEFTKK